jgi:adenosylcobinamide-phosphate synthase
LSAAVAVGLAAVLDRLFAEPPARVHPVALFGRLVAPFDREWTRPRVVGLAVALVLPLLAAGVVAGAVAGGGRMSGVALSGVGRLGTADVSLAAATLLAALALFSTASLRMLLDSAAGVVAASDESPDEARDRLRALAGREASGLSAGHVRSAAVESAAENLADGLVAPLGAFAVVAGGVGALGVMGPTSILALAAGAAAWVKAVNTLDSMLGYREKPVGWAPARLDDIVMWVPARASALALALAAGRPSALARAREAAREPASPNSGWPMATLAAVLGVYLEKPGHYALDGEGDERLPTRSEGERGVRLVGRAGWLAVAAAGVVAWA